MYLDSVFSNIRAELGRQRSTIEALCAQLGIPRSRFHRWEKKNDMPTSYLVKTADYFGLSCDYLLGLTDKRGGQDAEKGNSNVVG